MPKPRNWTGNEDHGATAEQVIEVEHDNWSGLLDQHGNKLVRPKEPVGFVVRRREK